MINIQKVKTYCNGDITLIENYDKAIADQTQTWECHHRKETDEGLTGEELKEMGLYYDRPPEEFILLTPQEHKEIHVNCKELHLKKCKKISQTLTGVKHSAERRKKNSESHKGKTPWNKGKTSPPETRAKLSESHRGEKNHNARAVYQIDKTTGKIIKKWNCIKDAETSLKCRHIVACCKGYHKTAGGYVWKYATDLEKVV